MKKLIALLLATLLICTLFAACGDKSVADDDDNSKPASQSASSGEGNGEETVAPTSFKSADIKYDGSILCLTYDSKANTLEFKYTSEAPAEVLEQLNLTGTLAEVRSIVYNVTKTAEGEYTVLKGTPSVVKIGIEGTAAEDYIKAAEELGAGADLIAQMKGQTITEKEKIESTTYMINETFTLKATISESVLVAVEIVDEFTEYGSQIACKEVYKIENNAVRSEERFESGESITIKNYDENGVLIEE